MRAKKKIDSRDSVNTSGEVLQPLNSIELEVKALSDSIETLNEKVDTSGSSLKQQVSETHDQLDTSLSNQTGHIETYTNDIDGINAQLISMNEMVNKLKDGFNLTLERVKETLDITNEATREYSAKVSHLYAQTKTSIQQRDELIAQERQGRDNDLTSILQSAVIPLHDRLFSLVRSIEAAGEVHKAGEIVNLLQTLESGLKRMNVEVIKPELGSEFDPAFMEAGESVQSGFLRRKKNTIARVFKCGFRLLRPNSEPISSSEGILRLPVVAVYASSTEEPGSTFT